MAEESSNTSEEIEENCIFCLIANGHDKEAKVMIKVHNKMICCCSFHPRSGFSFKVCRGFGFDNIMSFMLYMLHMKLCSSRHQACTYEKSKVKSDHKLL